MDMVSSMRRPWRNTAISLVVTLFIALLSSPVFASIEGTYSGSFLTGKSVGAYSYIHDSTAAKRADGDAGYTQYAGGNLIFAMDNTNSVSFNVHDFGSDGLGADLPGQFPQTAISLLRRNDQSRVFAF